MQVTVTWGNLNLQPGESAWDKARLDYGVIAFDKLSRWEQIAAVRQYVGRKP